MVGGHDGMSRRYENKSKLYYCFREIVVAEFLSVNPNSKSNRVFGSSGVQFEEA